MFCNQCGGQLLPGNIRCARCNAGVPDPESLGAVLCPYCRENIQPGALKCKHCSEFLVQRSSPAKDGAAAVMSFFIPGLGQIYHGKIGAGLGWLFAVALGYVVLVVPGLILHIMCVANAYSEQK